jgi:hypothetical protein
MKIAEQQITLFHPEAYESYDIGAAIEEAMEATQDGCQKNDYFFDGIFSWQRNLHAELTWDLTFSVYIPRVENSVTHRASSVSSLSFESIKRRAIAKSWSRLQLVKEVQMVLVALTEDTCFELSQDFKSKHGVEES